MADYNELNDISHDATLRNRVGRAITVKAQKIIDEVAPTTIKVQWAAQALLNPDTKVTALLNYLIAKNSGLTKPQILSATDSALQAQLDAAVEVLIANGGI